MTWSNRRRSNSTWSNAEGQTASGQTGRTVSGQTRPSVTPPPGGEGGNLFNRPRGIGQTESAKRNRSNGLERGH